MSTNKSREILACRRQVLSREQREGERQRAGEDNRQRERVRRRRKRRRRQHFSEESRQVERVRARRRKENYREDRRQAERDRARMNRKRQCEREIQRQRKRQQNNDMMTEGVVLIETLRTRTRRSLKTPKPRSARGEKAVTSAGETKLRMRTRRQRQSCANPLNSAEHIFVLQLVLYIINGNIQRGKGSFIVCQSRWKH